MSKSPIDKLGERLTRRLAGFSSRRSFLARLGMALLATPALPLLPVARASAADTPKTDFERYAQTTRSHQMQLLEVLRLGRRAVQLLRRRLAHLPARCGALAHFLDRHLRQS